MDPWQQALISIAIILLIIITGWFSGCETAIESCNQFKFRVLANDGNRTAKYVTKLIDKFNDNIISVLIGYNLTSTIMSTLSTIFFASLLLPQGLDNILSVIVISILCYIFSDTLPKIFARQAPDKYMRFSAYLMMGCYYIFWPFIKFFLLCSNLVKKMFKIKEEVALTEEDLSNAIDSFEDLGKLEEDESDYIQNALDFDDTTVKECFTPIDKMTMINIENLSNKELNNILLGSKFSRIPVYEGTKDNIIGILNVKNYFNAYMEDKHVSVPSILQDVYFIEPNTMIDDLFEGFKKHRTHIAIVKANNKVVGMITMDDVLEELVGEIPTINPVKINKEEK